MAGLLGSEGNIVTTEGEFDRVAPGSSADHLDFYAGAEAHFEKAAAEFTITLNGGDTGTLANLNLVEGAAFAAVLFGSA